ncbi:unnamed protein product [Cylicocyclus nassatus]|uniref:Uncharacterized protein n=1 Tax=Cylicocyclus nassatus TaxID=53992 RepID=A0AA36H2X8_CYLNA|nr:unnamed protein product [Cylicocyclus nassatus]
MQLGHFCDLENLYYKIPTSDVSTCVLLPVSNRIPSRICSRLDAQGLSKTTLESKIEASYFRHGSSVFVRFSCTVAELSRHIWKERPLSSRQKWFKSLDFLFTNVMDVHSSSPTSAECGPTANGSNGEVREGLLKSDTGETPSGTRSSGGTTPIRIISAINHPREGVQSHRLPPGVRVVRGSTVCGTSGVRSPTHHVRTVLGTGASHPGRMVSSGLLSSGAAGGIRSAPIRTVVGAGQGMRVVQQAGRTLIAVPSGSRLAATLSSVAARAAPVELTTTANNVPAISVVDVNRTKPSDKLDSDEQLSDGSVSTDIRESSVELNDEGEVAVQNANCITSVDGSEASTSQHEEPSLVLSEPTSASEEKEMTGLTSSGMVTRRMARGNGASTKAVDATQTVETLDLGYSRMDLPLAPPPRRRATKRPKYSLSTGELVRAQYILPPDQLPRRVSVPREENPLSLTEQARLSRRPIVVHSSGVEFAIPMSLEAHPMKLDDIAPENPREDILRDDDGVPYCYLCHSVLKTWQGYEYHVMAVHLKYRPYRCMYCMKEYFYTEEEGLSHVRSQHHGKTVTLLREYHDDKEKQLEDAFCALFMAVREGPNFTAERAAAIEKAAFMHLQKFKRMRMKVPEFATRAKVMRDFASQTFSTMSSPNSLLPTLKYMSHPRHQYEHLQHHLEPLQHPQISMPLKVMDVEHPDGQQRFVRMSNGELAEINDRYVIEGEEEDPVGEYIEVDYVDEIIEEEVGPEREEQEMSVRFWQKML